MNSGIWLMIGVAVLIVLLGIVAIVSHRKSGKKHKPNYHSMFIIGAIWFPLGVILMIMSDTSIGAFFFAVGWVYFVMGIVNRDKWDKNKSPYLIQNPVLRWIIVIILLILVLVGLIAFAAGG